MDISAEEKQRIIETIEKLK
jgi:hypothetical protein